MCAARRGSADETVGQIERSWKDGAKIPPEEWRETGNRAVCAETRRPARFRDPITEIPFYDLDVFRHLRQHFYFDLKKCHESILMENNGTRVTYAGASGVSDSYGVRDAVCPISMG